MENDRGKKLRGKDARRSLSLPTRRRAEEVKLRIPSAGERAVRSWRMMSDIVEIYQILELIECKEWNQRIWSLWRKKSDDTGLGEALILQGG